MMLCSLPTVATEFREEIERYTPMSQMATGPATFLKLWRLRNFLMLASITGVVQTQLLYFLTL